MLGIFCPANAQVVAICWHNAPVVEWYTRPATNWSSLAGSSPVGRTKNSEAGRYQHPASKVRKKLSSRKLPRAPYNIGPCQTIANLQIGKARRVLREENINYFHNVAI